MKTTLLVLLAVATALAAAAALRECAACGSTRFGLIGTVFYAGMFAATATFGPVRLVAIALLGAFGFHTALVASGSACPLCLASAACSLVITLVLLRDHACALVAAPWTAAVGLSLAPAPPPPAPERTVTVYTQDGCPYCDELRARVMPAATRDLDVRVRYVPASGAVRATPTIVIGRRVIEGLPSIDLLRRTILEGLETP